MFVGVVVVGVVVVAAVVAIATIITEVILRCPRFTLFVCICRTPYAVHTALHFVGSLYLHFMLFGSLLSKTSSHLMCAYIHLNMENYCGPSIHPSIYVCAQFYSVLSENVVLKE